MLLTWPSLSQFCNLKIRLSADYILNRNVVRWLLKNQICERVGRVLMVNNSNPSRLFTSRRQRHRKKYSWKIGRLSCQWLKDGGISKSNLAATLLKYSLKCSAISGLLRTSAPSTIIELTELLHFPSWIKPFINFQVAFILALQLSNAEWKWFFFAILKILVREFL